MEPVNTRTTGAATGRAGAEELSQGAKLIVDTAVKTADAPQQASQVAPSAPVASPATAPARTSAPAQAATAATATPTASLGSLSKIRQQFSSRQQQNTSQARALEPASLAKAWAAYAQQLRENKNPAVQSLELAELRIVDAQSFTVVTGNNLEQKFIEQEKRTLSEFLQKEFANKSISFAVIVEEKTDTSEPVERPLNTREQFLQIVEQYPLVKELKDRLKLDLDY